MVEENFQVQVQVQIQIQIRSIRSQMVLYFLFFPIFIKFLVNFRNIFTSKVTKLTILIDKGYFMTSSEIFMLPFVRSNIVWTIDIVVSKLGTILFLGLPPYKSDSQGNLIYQKFFCNNFWCWGVAFNLEFLEILR